MKFTKFIWLVLLLAACTIPLPSTTVPLLPPDIGNGSVDPGGKVTIQGIIDVDIDSTGEVVALNTTPNQRTPINLVRMDARYRFVYQSDTAPRFRLCLDFDWYAAWGVLSNNELFIDPNKRISVPIVFAASNTNPKQWVAEGQRSFNDTELQRLEAWLNSPRENSTATTGAGGTMRRCDGPNPNDNFGGVFKVERFEADLYAIR